MAADCLPGEALNPARMQGIVAVVDLIQNIQNIILAKHQIFDNKSSVPVPAYPARGRNILPEAQNCTTTNLPDFRSFHEVTLKYGKI